MINGIEKVDILDHKDLKGNIISNIEEAVIFLRRHLNVNRKIKGLHGTDVLEIPEEALRETIVNAVMHRDYSISGAHV